MSDSKITTAFVGGSIFSEALGAPQRAAVAIRDGRIAAIGTDEQIRDLTDASTDIGHPSGTRRKTAPIKTSRHTSISHTHTRTHAHTNI